MGRGVKDGKRCGEGDERAGMKEGRVAERDERGGMEKGKRRVR